MDLNDEGCARSHASNMTVDMILGDSFIKEIRNLSKLAPENPCANQLLSEGSEADVSDAENMWNKICDRISKEPKTVSDSICSNEFVGFDQVNKTAKSFHSEL